jgi:hypothetical protein
MSPRLHAGALALVAALAVAAPAPGQTGTEQLRELWSEYPLNPERKEGGTGRPKDDRLPLQAPGPAQRAVEPPAGEFKITLALVVGASLGALALLVFIATVRRAPQAPAERPRRPTPAPARPAAPAPPPRRRLRAAKDYEVCIVCRWHGYVKSQYCALAVSPEGRERVVARSPEFRWWRDEPPPPAGAALAAHAALARLLEAEGWEREEGSETGGLWDETTFRRPLAPSLDELADELAGEPRRSGSAG